MNKVNIGFDNIQCIAHIADVHIRNLRRHKEYKQVFRKLYKDLKDNLPENSLIYLAGDIAHAKTEMSPELIEMTSDLFTKLSKIAPTILIAGNHDCNLNNKSRLDALSPIVDSLHLDNFYYLKDNGLYEVADCVFNVMSVFNDPDEYILSKNINTDKTKIALYHGSVESATTDVGFKLPGEVTTDIFNGYDMVLLGDIHKQQYLNKEKTIVLINPEITKMEGRIESKEGCLSIPGFYEYVYRYEKIEIKAYDLTGKEVIYVPDGIQSVVFQHEFDHLNGVLYTSRLALSLIHI